MAPQLRKQHGAKELDSEASRVSEALDELGLDADDEDLRVLVNGRAIAFLDGVATELGAEDVVSIYFTGIRGFPGG